MKSTTEGVTQVVRQIYARDGEVRASVLVEEARPKESPAHDAFEWRDKVAAHEYRLTQARQMIRLVTIERGDYESQLVHVASEKGDQVREGVYKPIDVIVESPTEFETALSAALQRLASARKAVEELSVAARKLSPTDDRTAIIAQIAESLSLLNTALEKAVH
jgi:hypothetical protein